MPRVNRNMFSVRPGMIRGFTSGSPIPTRIVSNEEFNPLPQTPEQAHVEYLIQHDAAVAARRLGIRRRDFLRTGGGMATALLAMNTVFGKFFDVLEMERVEAAAFAQAPGRTFLYFRRSDALCQHRLRSGGRGEEAGRAPSQSRGFWRCASRRRQRV